MKRVGRSVEAVDSESTQLGSTPRPAVALVDETRSYLYQYWRDMRYSHKHLAVPMELAWLVFESFLAAVDSRPDPKAYLRRVDRAAGFVVGNLVWGTRGQQMLGKSDARTAKMGDESLQLIELARRAGVRKSTMHYRMQHWPKARWLEPPSGTGPKRKVWPPS